MSYLVENPKDRFSHDAAHLYDKLTRGPGALAGQPGGGGGGLADQLSTDRKTYPKQCVRHFEIDTPFHCTQSKSNLFQCCKLKCLLSYCCQPFVNFVKNIPFSYKNRIFPTLKDDSAVHCPAHKKYSFSSFFFLFMHPYTTDHSKPPPPTPPPPPRARGTM